MQDGTPRKLSTMLEEDLKQLPDADISVAQILELFHERGFGFFLFLFSLPMALPIPVPPGINIMFALPLLFLTFQQMIRRHSIWLPQFIIKRTIASSSLSGLILNNANPFIRKIEIIIKPRLGEITKGFSSSLIGLAGLIMALAICIPIPLSNTIPSFGIALMAIGVLMRDGIAVIIGMIVGLLWVIILSWALIYFGNEGIDILKEWIKSWL